MCCLSVWMQMSKRYLCVTVSSYHTCYIFNCLFWSNFRLKKRSTKNSQTPFTQISPKLTSHTLAYSFISYLCTLYVLVHASTRTHTWTHDHLSERFTSRHWPLCTRVLPGNTVHSARSKILKLTLLQCADCPTPVLSWSMTTWYTCLFRLLGLF